MPLIDLNGLGHFKDKENAMIAEDFSASKAYAAGDYCYYNGTLYKFKTAHAAGAWTIADVEAAKLAHDVSDLKESIHDIYDGVLSSGEKVNGTILFNSNVVSVGEIIEYDLTANTGFAGFIELLDSNDARIAYYGKPSSTWSENHYVGTFEIPNNFAYAKCSGPVYFAYIRKQKYLDDVYEKIESLDAQVSGSAEIFSGAGLQSGYIPSTLAIGDTISFTANSYRRIYQTQIGLNDEVWIINCSGYDTGCYPWAITDNDNKIIALPQNATTIDRMSCKIIAPENASKLYWVVTQQKSIVVKENNKFVLYNGIKHNSSVTTVSAVITDCAEIVNNEKTKVATVSNGGYIKCSFTSGKYITTGVWIKVNYQANLLSKLNIVLMSGDTTRTTIEIPPDRLKIGEWIFAKASFMNNDIDNVKIEPIFSDSDSEIQIIFCPVIITDHITRPISIINFDQAWQATEDCGAYDLLINNSIPFTITGTLENVDAQTQDKLLKAYGADLLDVGIYGNEAHNGQNYPINSSVDMDTAYTNMLNLLEAKNELGVNAVSFGPASHIITPTILRTIKDFGFKITRVYGDPSLGNAAYDQKDFIALTEGHTSYNEYQITAQTITGGVFAMFAHGVSSNPSSEDNPSLYTPFASFSNTINTIIKLVENHSIEPMNMKQFAEYVSTH